MKVTDALIAAKFANSKGDARRKILGKGVRINDFLVEDPEAEFWSFEESALIREKNKLTRVWNDGSFKFEAFDGEIQ